jgi:hypothetical protein
LSSVEGTLLASSLHLPQNEHTHRNGGVKTDSTSIERVTNPFSVPGHLQTAYQDNGKRKKHRYHDDIPKFFSHEKQ